MLPDTGLTLTGAVKEKTRVFYQAERILYTWPLLCKNSEVHP
jgi:hypothetical protein